ncbi:MAG: HU family DNA-binding protein [Pseudomonadota bacterium]
MLKSQLIEKITKKQRYLSKADVTSCVNLIIDTMTKHLSKKSDNPGRNRIEIRGFGSFSLHYRRSHIARNPKNGDTFFTREKFAVHYKMGKEMRELINQSPSIQD